MGRLERHLDTDLIARIRAGTKEPPGPMKRLKPPRSAHTYRSAWRNRAREIRREVVRQNNEARQAQ